eukprot:EG_transcript_13844
MGAMGYKPPENPCAGSLEQSQQPAVFLLVVMAPSHLTNGHAQDHKDFNAKQCSSAQLPVPITIDFGSGTSAGAGIMSRNARNMTQNRTRGVKTLLGEVQGPDGKRCWLDPNPEGPTSCRLGQLFPKTDKK